MADQLQLSLLKQGVKAWNEWRLEHEPDQADLSGADLSGVHLREANLIGTTLREANLSGADLREVDLSGANLRPTKYDQESLRISEIGRTLAATSTNRWTE